MVAIETDAKKLFNSAGELATGFVLLRLPAELETGDGLMLTTRGRWAVKAGVFVDGATKTLPAGAEVEIVHVFNVDDDSGRGVRKDRTTRWVEVPAGTTLEYVDLITDHVTVPPAAGPGVPAWAAELLEAIGDMETLTDTTMAAVAADEDSAFSVQQRATIDALVPALLPPILTPCEVLAGVLDFGALGHYRGAIAGDSTWNDGNDPNRKMLLRLAELTPDEFGLREYLTAGGGSPTYGTTVTVRAGDTTPDTGGTVMLDNFNRSGELSGSTSSGGQVWASVATGVWSGDGSHATAPSGTTALVFNAGSKDQTVIADAIVVTTSPASTRQIRVIACASTTSPTTGGSYLWVQIGISTSGIATAALWKRISGVNTQIGSTLTLTSTGLPSNSSTPVTVEIELDVAVQAVAATLRISGQSDQVISGTISEGDVALIGTYAGFSATNAATAILVDSVDIAIPFTPGTYRGLDMYNGAVAGTSLDYQTTHVAALYPDTTPLDFILVTQGHNSTGLDEAAFLERVDDFVTAFQALHPTTPILIVSQNPQFAPAVTITAHARNQRALRAYAMDKGFEYLPVFEAFTDQADGGASLVNSGDGIHPTTSGTTDITTWCGSLLITSVWLRAVNGRRRVAVGSPITALP